MILSIGMFASAWPAFITGHSWIVWITAAVGFVLLGAGFIWPTEKGDIPIQSVISGNLVGRDNSGRMIERVEHYHEAPATHKEEPANYTKIDTLPTIPEKKVAAKSTLQVEKPNFHLLLRTHTNWQLASPGVVGDVILGAVAWVHNPTAEEGELAQSINSATASVIYRGDNGVLASVPTAYWLDRYENQIEIKIGQRRGILLGILPNGFDGQIFTALENTDPHPFRPRLDRAVIVPIPKDSPIAFSRIREIEISIVSQGVTLKKFNAFVEPRGPGKWDLTLAKTA